MMIFKSKIHRSRNDVIASILTSTTEPIDMTRIMCVASLSSERIRGYLVDLIEQGLLSYDVGSKTFAIMDAGKKYLRLHNTMLRIGRRLDRL